MYEQIVGLIHQALRPHDDQHASVLARIEELERRVRNIIQPGRVAAIHPNGTQIRVIYGRNQTPWINWFAPAAGQMREYRCPSKGEQCVLINYGGGDNSTQAWALCGVWSDQYPAPADQPHLHVIDWGGGIRLEVDRSAGTASWSVPGGMALDTPDIQTTGELHTAGDQVAGNVSTQHHLHGGVVPGASNTEEPVQ